MTKHDPYRDCAHCSPEHENKHESKVVFSCGTGVGANLPVNSQVAVGTRSTLQGAYQQPGLVVGTVTLDTGGLKSPTVKIDYSSVISFKTNSPIFEIEIRFQLSRVCNNGQKVPLGTWTYEREVGYNLIDSQVIPGIIDIFYVEFKDPIAFTWCDCHDCPGCCTYIVEIVDVDTENIDFALISNVGINAFAISK